MALKGERVILETDITLTCQSATNRGVVLCYKTSGSGVNLGESAGAADLMANPSGFVPAGLLLGDVVNIDLTRYHLNFHKDEVQVGMRVNLLRKGRVTIDGISGTPAVGDTAYLTTNGNLTNTLSATGGLKATPKVGQFQSIKDENGFATVDINLPNF
jgi:hypothetical protein